MRKEEKYVERCFVFSELIILPAQRKSNGKRSNKYLQICPFPPALLMQSKMPGCKRGHRPPIFVSVQNFVSLFRQQWQIQCGTKLNLFLWLFASFSHSTSIDQPCHCHHSSVDSLLTTGNTPNWSSNSNKSLLLLKNLKCNFGLFGLLFAEKIITKMKVIIFI